MTHQRLGDVANEIVEKLLPGSTPQSAGQSLVAHISRHMRRAAYHDSRSIGFSMQGDDVNARRERALAAGEAELERIKREALDKLNADQAKGELSSETGEGKAA